MKAFYALILGALLLIAFPLFAQTQTVRGVDAMGRPIFVNVPTLPISGLVSSLTVNGQRLTGDVKIEAQGASFDPSTNTLLLAESRGLSGKGADALGNVSIAGTLTVTSSCYLNTSGGNTYTYGAHISSYGAPTANTSITIIQDVTDIADAGADVTITLPTAVNGRALFIYNESATYNVTDGGSITVTPNSGLTLHAVGGAWK